MDEKVTSNKQKVMSNEQKVTSNGQKVTSNNIVCIPLHLSVGDGVEPPTKFSKRRGLTASQFLGGGLLGKRG